MPSIQGLQSSRTLPAALIWAGPLLLAVGLVTTPILQTLPHAHAAELLAITLLALGPAALAHKLWRVPIATVLAVAFAVALIAFAGVVPVLATTVLLLAALGIGSLFSADGRGDIAAAIAGVALISGLDGWLLPLPLHYRLGYFLVLSTCIVLTRARIGAALRAAAAGWHTAVAQDPNAAAAAALVSGLASVGCWIPTVQFDDLSYHLGLPAQLAAWGYYRMDAHSQIWALAPWAGDVVQGIAQLLAGREARGAVDAGWLCAIVALIWQLAAALDLSVRVRWLSALLAASLPMTAALAGGMQAELPATAAALALALTVARSDATSPTRSALQFALLSGLLLALKAGFIALVVPLLACSIWRRRSQLSLRGGLAAVMLCALVAGSSYFYAEILSGNPLFPLLNATFRSPLMDAVDLGDPRWTQPLSWDFPWRLTFFSRDYGEGWDGLAGFSLLGLLGAVPLALGARHRWLAWCALLSFGAAISAVHYFRYVFPALVLLTPCLIGALHAYLPQRAALYLVGALALLNVLYQGAAFWTLHSGAITREVAALDSAPVLRRFAPERLLIASARQRQPDAQVLLCDPKSPFAAELGGRGFTISHYDPELSQRALAADDDASGAAWRALIAYTGARFAIVNAQTATPALQAALSGAQRLTQIETAELWQLPAVPADAVDLTHARDEAVHLRP